MPFTSETAKARERLAQYCRGNGLDLGFGGDPIVPWAITIDRKKDIRGNIDGDATKLCWFQDNAFDFVYSSHLLEDFKETEPVLREWLRVIKPGGLLVLYLPNEQIYKAHCIKTGQPYNTHHSQPEFSLEFLKKIFQRIGGTTIVHDNPHTEIYSFEIVVRK